MAKRQIPNERARAPERGSRIGRPPLPAGRARSERVVSFVTAGELESLKVIADARGASVSAVIHQILSASLSEEK